MVKPRTAPALKSPRRATPVDRIPRRVSMPTLDDHLEIMTRAVFQAGLSWAIIDARWNTFQLAFSQFAVRRVAGYDDYDVERLMATDGLIHSRKKIEGSIRNARALLEIDADFGGIAPYVAQFSSYGQIRDDVRERFAFVGDLSCYYWLFRTGQRVPLFENWSATQRTDHPRMREMVFSGRADGSSTEVAGFE